MARFRWPAVVALTAVALIACYARTLLGMSNQWWYDDDMGHGFLVPIVILWIAARERKRWQTLPAQPGVWGFPLLAAAAAIHTAGVLGGGLFLSSVAFLVSVAGAILCLGGSAWLRACAFPLTLALFMLPKLAIVYNQVTLPLQLLASRIAVSLLWLTGSAATRQGNILEIAGRQIAVAEACSGIRYLIPLAFVAVVFAYFADPKPWMRLALPAAAVPTAILANAARVAAAAWLPALSTGAFHSAAGVVIFMLCLPPLVLLHRLINAVHARHYV